MIGSSLPHRRKLSLWMVKKTTQILKVSGLYRISMTIFKNIGDSLEIEQLCFPLLGRTFGFTLFVLFSYILFCIINVRTLNFEMLPQTFKYLSFALSSLICIYLNGIDKNIVINIA